ncbi:MAG: HisA/HisF-related TIM barrel protein [Candidatus Methanoperedens sp.]|nr:HisA/HisF-related TIM barrel protein [Candidatus Methanoperedens sp.]
MVYRFLIHKRRRYGKIFDHLSKSIYIKGSVLLGLVDPDKCNESDSADLASAMEIGGADAILVGGSIGAESEVLSDATRSIKKKSKYTRKIEPIPVVYMIIEPGQTAGWVCRAIPLPRGKPELAVIGALSAEYSGAKMVLIDAGSESQLDVPSELISQVSSEINIPLIFAGGIRTPEQAYQAIKNGASGIQIGTAAEDSEDALNCYAGTSNTRVS